jgi:diguanylate cyclase (GGDEF)-like protein/PAS domain S-box-containing protein
MRDEEKSKEQLISELAELRHTLSDLRESESDYRDLFECSVDGLAVIDAETLKIILCNKRAASLYGFESPNDAIGVNPLDFIHPEDKDRAIKHIVEYLFKQDLREANVFRTLTKDGKDKWISAIGIVIDYHGKKAALASFRDITQSKLTEESLRASEQKLRLTFESINEAIILTELEGNLLDINEAGLRMSGYDLKTQVIGLSGLTFFLEEDKPRILKELDELMRTGRSPILSFKLVNKNGLTFDAEASAVLMHDNSGRPTGIIIVVRDVSERRRIEEALRDSEEKLRLTFESIEDGIVIIDLNGIILDVNEATLRIGGYDHKSQVIGSNAFELIAPKDYKTVMDDLKASLEGRPKERMEYSIQTKGSKVIEVELTASIIRDEEGNPTQYIAVLRDITERKQAENQLRESEQKYKELVEREKDVIFSVDKSGTVTSINSAVAVWGYKPEEIVGRSYSEFVPPRLLEKLEAVLPTQLMTTGEVVAEALGLDKDGRWRPIEFSGTVILKDNQFAGIRGIVRDITERKHAEEALKQRNRELATLNKIAESVSHPVGLNRVLRTALDSVLETMHFVYSSIWLLETGSSELHLATARGSKDLLITVADMSTALKTGKPTVAIYYAEGKHSKSSKTPPDNEGKSVIGIPLKSKGEIFGVLGVVGDSQALSDDDMRLLETIGDQIAVAIENAQLLEKLNKLSITDELTGLYNRRRFYEVLESEMNRTRRYGRCISLAMIDLDGFKKYNDRFGHASGDVILTDFANALKEGLRRTDTAFRYGGDEFIVILPSTNAERAKEVIERIRKKWLKRLAAQQPGLEKVLGFSAGIAQFPENAETVDGLVFLTDTALYYAKRGGKQRVMLISDLGTSSLDVLSSPALDQIYALAATVDTRDPFTYGHSKRVAAIAESLGKTIGLRGDELSELVAAAFLHDIGKVGVADVILTKPGKPEKEEWEAIQKHCAEGAKIIKHVKELAPLAPYILHHHEWYDGSGYPDRLSGEKIPLSARIISVADAYDTMTAQRPYREAISPQEALKEMERCSGTQFDPKLIEALLRISHSSLHVTPGTSLTG